MYIYIQKDIHMHICVYVGIICMQLCVRTYTYISKYFVIRDKETNGR